VTVRVVSAPYVFLGRADRTLDPLPGPLPSRERGTDTAGRAGPSRERGTKPDGHLPLSPTGGEGQGEGADPRVLRDAAVALDGDHILAVGARTEIEGRYGRGEALDAVLLPALVNAHTHLELSHLHRRIGGGEGLASWIQLLVAARAVEDPHAGAALDEAILQLEEAGVAAVGEVTNTLAALPRLARARLAGTVYHEVFGFSGARIEAALAAAAGLRARAGAPPAGLAIAPSPHAVYSTNPRVLAELLRAGPASIHLAEDPAERAFCARMAGPFASLVRALGAVDLRPLGRSAVAVAAPHLGPRSLAVHAVDLDAEDLADLVRSRATVVLCPRSNLHVGGRLADLPRLLAAGIPLAVGTDSLASCPSLSPLAELAALARAFPDVPADRLLQLAWNGPAVGAPAVGRLAPGTAPGLLAAPLAGLRPADPAAWLLGTFGAEERPLGWIARHHPEALAA
jgi:aminodeoxyfutalosine deaminase